MSLRNLIQKSAVTAFKVMGDIPQAGVFRSKVASNYDPSNPSTAGYAEEVIPLEGVLVGKFTEVEIKQNGLVGTEQKLVIPSLYFHGRAPRVDDIIEVDAFVYIISSLVKADPADALMILAGSKP